MMNILATALAAIVLLPISDARAETADEVRKRAFEVLVKRADEWRKRELEDIEDGTLKNIYLEETKTLEFPLGHFDIIEPGGKSTRPMGFISRVRNISCLTNPYSATVFQFTGTEDGKSDRDISVTVPATFEFKKKGGSSKPYIDVVDRSAQKTAPIPASQAAYRNSGAVIMIAGVKGTGRPTRTTRLYVYTVPVSEGMNKAASELCAESDAEKLLTIARKHKLIE
jgi:hypothetical protein